MNDSLSHLYRGMKHQRRLIDQPPPSTDFVADLRVQVIGDTLLCLCDDLFPHFSYFGIGGRIDNRSGIEAIIPDLQRTHLGTFA
jgi:hypothetical protein